MKVVFKYFVLVFYLLLLTNTILVNVSQKYLKKSIKLQANYFEEIDIMISIIHLLVIVYLIIFLYKSDLKNSQKIKWGVISFFIPIITIIRYWNHKNVD